MEQVNSSTRSQQSRDDANNSGSPACPFVSVPWNLSLSEDRPDKENRNSFLPEKSHQGHQDFGEHPGGYCQTQRELCTESADDHSRILDTSDVPEKWGYGDKLLINWPK